MTLEQELNNDLEKEIAHKTKRLERVQQLLKMAEVFESRCVANNYKGKTKLKMQAEFFMGAHIAEWVVDNEKVADPIVYFSIMRGDSILQDCKDVINQLGVAIVELQKAKEL